MADTNTVEALSDELLGQVFGGGQVVIENNTCPICRGPLSYMEPDNKGRCDIYRCGWCWKEYHRHWDDDYWTG